MYKQSEIPLYGKLFQLLKLLYKIFKNTPRQYKYNLADKAVNLCWQCLDLFFEANSVEKELRREKIAELSLCFDRLKLRLRMMKEIGIISPRQFAHLYEYYLKEIGEMIGGWLKWAK